MREGCRSSPNSTNLGLHNAEQQHQAKLRQEAAHAKAAEWSVPLVAQCLYWVEMQQAEYSGQDVAPFVQPEQGSLAIMQAPQVVRSAFRLATEHPTPAVPSNSKELYNRLSTYIAPKRARDDELSFSSLYEPNSEVFSGWKKYLEFMLLLVHPSERSD